MDKASGWFFGFEEISRYKLWNDLQFHLPGRQVPDIQSSIAQDKERSGAESAVSLSLKVLQLLRPGTPCYPRSISSPGCGRQQFQWGAAQTASSRGQPASTRLSEMLCGGKRQAIHLVPKSSGGTVEEYFLFETCYTGCCQTSGLTSCFLGRTVPQIQHT